MQRSLKDIFQNHKSNSYEEDLYKVKKVPYSKDDMRLLENLMKSSLYGKGKNKSGTFKSSGGKGSAAGGGYHNDKDQRVTFKMSYSNSKKVHENYLRTYMPQENKSYVEEKPQLFGTAEDVYNMNMDDLHFKCILSPENQNVNLELLSKEFIKRIETLTGYKLYWQGCIHNDTEHRHAHLCINGKDQAGKKVRFQKEMIKTTMRETLSYVTTLMVGERTQAEIAAERKGYTKAKRWTKLDDKIESYGDKISLSNLPEELMSRLAFLSEIGLADKHDKYYTVKSDWKDVLISTGRYNTYFDEWQKYHGNLELYAGGSITGTCENVITFDKDEAWNDAVIINTGDKNIYVPIWQLNKDNLIGKEIHIQGGTRALSRQLRSSDIKIIDDKKKGKPLHKKNSQKY